MLNMDQSLEQQDSNKRQGDIQVRVTETENQEKSNKCNQCEYASSYVSDLRRHLKIHSGKNQTNATNATMRARIQVH